MPYFKPMRLVAVLADARHMVTEARRAGIEHVAFQAALEAEGSALPSYFHLRKD